MDAASAAARLSGEAQQVAQWIVATRDNQRLPYLLIDKRAARMHVFDAAGTLQASSAVLLGLARGDHSVPGIGERPMSAIAPHERTTPAGRFISEPGHNLQGEDIVWIDYDAAVSLHRVRTANAADRRLQRLATATVADNRISYGCVNVPQNFYDRNVAPMLGQKPGVIYVLPETQSAASFFGFDTARKR
ncbi:MAG: L,D-transpeptidase [Comamonas sp.]